MRTNLTRLMLAAALGLSLGGCASDFEDPGPVGRLSPGVYPRVVRGPERLQCVPYARAQSGVGIWGDANIWWGKAAGRFERSSTPEPGSVIVMRGQGGRGHVAVVRRVLSEREIVVDHANWLNSGEIGLDNPVMDVSDDNDWSEVRVWYAPGRHYGGRVYGVQGFILGPSSSQQIAAR
jgi:hypothetical protein